VETYTTFPISLLKMGPPYQTPPYKYDISAVLRSSYQNVPAGDCMIIGFAVDYTSLAYPITQDFLSGVVVSPTPAAYILADGATTCDPAIEPTCTATTASGAWVGVQDPAAPVAYSGAKEGSAFVGGNVTCVADTANVTGLIDILSLP
jgi:hypothetical protein